LDTRPVEAAKGSRGRGPVELGAIGSELGLQIVEDALRQTARVGISLHHERSDRADEHRFRDPALPVSGDVAHDLTTAGRVADMNGVLEIEMCSDRGQVIGVMVHIVTITGL
jgi:hypothetical protein